MKGIATGFIWILLGLFMFSMMYMLLNEVYIYSDSYATSQITETSSLTTLRYLDIMWTYWPLVILIGGYLMYMYTRSQKRDLV